MQPSFNILAFITVGLPVCTRIDIRACSLGHNVWLCKFKMLQHFGPNERPFAAFILPRQATNSWPLSLPVQSMICTTTTTKSDTWCTCVESMFERATCHFLWFNIHSTIRRFVALRRVYRFQRPFFQHCPSVPARNCSVIHTHFKEWR